MISRYRRILIGILYILCVNMSAYPSRENTPSASLDTISVPTGTQLRLIILAVRPFPVFYFSFCWPCACLGGSLPLDRRKQAAEILSPFRHATIPLDDRLYIAGSSRASDLTRDVPRTAHHRRFGGMTEEDATGRQPLTKGDKYVPRGGQQRASSGAGRTGAALVVSLQGDRRACPGRRASHIVCPLVGLGRKGRGGSARTQRDKLPSCSTHRRKLLDGNSAQRVAPGTLSRSRDYPHTRTPTRCLPMLPPLQASPRWSCTHPGGW